MQKTKSVLCALALWEAPCIKVKGCSHEYRILWKMPGFDLHRIQWGVILGMGIVSCSDSLVLI